MATTLIRIGVVGLDHWYWAFSFAEAVSRYPEAVIVAVADGDAERAAICARRYGVERTTTRVQELFDAASIDLIVSFGFIGSC
jgi:predicted dehydrogenase